MKDKQQCKEEIAKENNFDSFDRALRYTFNRQLLQSEHDFINKIIDEAMDRYVQQQVKNLNIPDVSNTLPFDFVLWYSGMEKEKIQRAYQRFLREKGI